MRYYRFMGFVMVIIGKIIIVTIFIICGILLGEAILESEEAND